MAIKLKRTKEEGSKVIGTFRKWTDIANFIERKKFKGNFIAVSIPLKTVGGIKKVKVDNLGIWVEERGYI